MTASHRFEKGYYGLTDKPIKIKTAVFCNLRRLEITYCFLDANLFVSKGSVNEYLKHVFDCLKLFDLENLRINQPECPSVKTECPPEHKTSTHNTFLWAAKNALKFCSLAGSVHYISKSIPK